RRIRRLREARAGEETASRELERIRGLEAKGYVATRQLDATQLDFERARSRLERAQEDAKRLEQRQRLAREQAEQAVLRAQAELDRVLANRIQDANKRREYENAIADVRKSEAALADVQILQKVPRAEPGVGRSIAEPVERHGAATGVRPRFARRWME
ncbi:MAG: hypothetical protein UZ18_ATM001001108, partial [Armatimonadetes bacterium OLB18]